MGAGSRSVRAALAIACMVALCPRGAGAEGQEGSPGPATAAPQVQPAGVRAPAQVPAIPCSAQLPLQFEEIPGATHRRSTFVARGPGYDVAVTSGEATLTLRKKGAAHTDTVRMTLIGANAAGP